MTTTIDQVENITPIVQYIATGGQTVYPYPFPITQAADIIVTVNVVPTGAFSLTGIGNDTGGNVTLNSGSTAGDIVTVYRSIAITRATQFAQNGGFSSAAFNAEYNKIYLILQQLANQYSLSLPVTNSPTPNVVLTPAQYAGKYLAFDQYGNPQPTTLPTLSTPAGGAILIGQTAAEATASFNPTAAQQLFPVGNIQRYGADPAGTADSTAAIVLACACSNAVFVPAGTFKFTHFVMPVTFGFTFYGLGTASILKQIGTGITWPVNSSVTYAQQTIRDLSFISTSGTGHTINTQYTGGNSLTNLYFTDTPNGFDNIHLDGSTTTYTHDMRLRGIQIYYSSGSGGHAGIGVGAFMSDSYVTDFIMNATNGAGTQGASYCVYLADGAQSMFFSNSHPYGGLINVIGSAATGAVQAYGFSFNNCVLDTAYGGDIVSLVNYNCPIFVGCWLQGVVSGFNAITLNNCRSSVINSCRFDGAAGSHYVVNEVGNTDYTNVIGGDSPSIVNFLNPPFNLIGAHSVVKNFIAYNVFGEQLTFVGSTTATVSAASTVYLGCNGAQSTVGATAFNIPLISGANVLRADIAVDVAPGAAQTYTFTLTANGSTVMGAASGSANPLVLTGTGAFSGSIIIAPGAGAFLSQFNQLSIKMVSSAGAGTPNVRYSIQTIG